MIFGTKSTPWYIVPDKKKAWFMVASSVSKATSYAKEIKKIIKKKAIAGITTITYKDLLIIEGSIDAAKSLLGTAFDPGALDHNNELYYSSLSKTTSKFVPRGKRGSGLFIKNKQGRYTLWEPLSDIDPLGYHFFTASTRHVAHHIVNNLNRSGVAKVHYRKNTVFATLDTLKKLDKACQSGIDTLKPSIRTLEEGPPPPDLYWYEDREMNLILLHSIANSEYRSAEGVPVYIKGPCDNLSFYGLSHALIEHEKKDGILLIPFNLGLLHWVGLELVYNEGLLVAANYYDPMGNEVPEFLNSILAEIAHGITSWTDIKDERLIRQTNGSDCGPCTIESLLAAAGYKESTTTTATGRRKRHLELLEIAEPEFYADFSVRQAMNASSFSKMEHSSTGVDLAVKHVGWEEYLELMRLALAILNTEKEVRNALIAAIGPKDITKSEKHINDLRTILSTHFMATGVYDIAKFFFHLTSDLEDAPLRIAYNQIEIVKKILVSFTADELRTQLNKNGKLPWGLIPDLMELCGCDEEDNLAAPAANVSGTQTPNTELLPAPAKRPRLEVSTSLSDEEAEEAPSLLPYLSTPLSLIPSPLTNSPLPSPMWPTISSVSTLRALSIFSSQPSPDRDISPSECGVGMKRNRLG